MTLYEKYKDDIKLYKKKHCILFRSNRKVLEDICIKDIKKYPSLTLSHFEGCHLTDKIISYYEYTLLKYKVYPTLYEKYKNDIKLYKKKHCILFRSNRKVLEDICIKDIYLDSRRFLSIHRDHWTTKIIMYTLSRNGNYLMAIDKKMQTFDMALMAVLTSKSSLQYINKKFIKKLYKKINKSKYVSIGKWKLDDNPLEKKVKLYYMRRLLYSKYCANIKKTYKNFT